MKELTEIANRIGNLDKGANFGECHGFTEFYHDYFDKIRKRAIDRHEKVRILEIGVWKGGSLQMYNEFFGQDNCEIYGIDYDLDTNQYHADNVHLFYADQNSIESLLNTAREFPEFDIIIDDGGHQYHQQFNTMFAYRHLLKKDGIYILEDLHSSIDPIFGGNYHGSPLYFLTTGCQPNTLTIDQYNILKELVSDVVLFRSSSPVHHNYNNSSITSIITFKHNE